MTRKRIMTLMLLIIAMLVMAAEADECEDSQATVVEVDVEATAEPATTATTTPLFETSNSDGSPVETDTRIEFERIKVNRTDGGTRSEYVTRFYDTERGVWCWVYENSMDCS